MLEFFQSLLTIRDTDQMYILLGIIVLDVGLTLVLGKKYYRAADTFVSVVLGVVYALVIALMFGVVFALYSWVHQNRLLDLDWQGSVGLLLLAYVLIDFAFYVYHRAIHVVRIGWAAHVNHHSSQYFNVGTALRASFVEAFYEPLAIAPLALLGIDPIILIAFLSLNHLYQYWLHTNHIGKLGPLEWVLNTPSHHRVHHGSNIQYCDKNFAGTFIIWDRLFGTFEEEKEQPVFGIIHQLESHNPIWVTFHEWVGIAKDLRKARSVREVLGYLFMAPGWAPNGQSETTRVMQAQLKQRQEDAG